MKYTIEHIANICSGELHLKASTTIEHLVIDSRKVYFPSNSLFVAIIGSQHNGHRFISALYEKGVRNFVVSEALYGEQFVEANFIRVADTTIALQQLAATHRQQFHYPVIGITGSNGKTIVKEWLFHLLNADYDIVRSPRSFNSQVGVPLAVWQMNETYDLGIFEAGISLPNEMQKLQKLMNPEIGIFTFLGDAHAEGFTSLTQKTKEKLQLFINSKLLFYNMDQVLLHDEILVFKNEHPDLELFNWGRNESAQLVVKNLNSAGNITTVQLQHKANEYQFQIPFVDEASIHNAITCIAVLLYLKIDQNIIADRLLQLRSVEMRLELKQGINQCVIINDSYSADIDSLAIALHFLEQQKQHPTKTVILSDLFQTGKHAEALYHQIADMLQQKNINRFIGIGPTLQQYAYLFASIPVQHFYESTASFLAALPTLHLRQESILLKGARVFRFENISKKLEQKIHQTFLEINLNAIRHNIKVYQRQLHKGVKMMCMVKAFGYGSGSYEIAGLLQHMGIEYLGVAYADEGVELRNAGIRIPIMVMNTEEAGFDYIVKYNLEPELYSFKILLSFTQYLFDRSIESHPVHLKIETGMQRLGFEQQDINELCSYLKQHPRLKIKSVFSHLAAGGDPQHDIFTQQQGELLVRSASKIEQIIGYPVIKHIANTSGIFRHPNLQLQMVRLGIGMYGVDPQPEIHELLQNITTLKTSISQIKHISKGTTVGYSRSAIAEQNTTIATVRIGYADGYPRLLGNGKGYMLVNGKSAKVIGSVCMDMTMLDITGIDAAEEDEVIVFGEDLPSTLLAEWAGTIPYEIFTNISQRVRRVYFEE
ncbi:MAG: bifunctional UDP-N-acetylmuramoyl-tripeptide:D-alanyl-D-alanine ligase/alanine racemase [Ferruginibacter sp.]